jgi:hypothetical protein
MTETGVCRLWLLKIQNRSISGKFPAASCPSSDGAGSTTQIPADGMTQPCALHTMANIL